MCQHTHAPASAPARAHACSPPASLPRGGGSLGLRPAARARDHATETRQAGPTPLSWAAVSPGRCWGTSFGCRARCWVGGWGPDGKWVPARVTGGLSLTGGSRPLEPPHLPTGGSRKHLSAPGRQPRFSPPAPTTPPPRPWKLDLGGPGKEPVLPTCQFWRILSRTGTSEDGRGALGEGAPGGFLLSFRERPSARQPGAGGRRGPRGSGTAPGGQEALTAAPADSSRANPPPWPFFSGRLRTCVSSPSTA